MAGKLAEDLVGRSIAEGPQTGHRPPKAAPDRRFSHNAAFAQFVEPPAVAAVH